MNEITMIPVEKLHHHPENPRKDLGDLTELADSIRKNGVMQNLTVVRGHRMSKSEWVAAARAEGADKASAEASYDPEHAEVSDGYTVVIGNRRMEAAKAAGLAEVPCVISDMDHRTQISTMLMENMQRADLTVYEQAQGFQMMMDLGFTAEEIGEKTGFSEKTVKDRIRLTKLDGDRFRKAVQHGMTIMDLVEISKLEKKGDQNELMEIAGSEVFHRKLTEKKQEQEKRNFIKWTEPILKEYAQALPENASLYGANPDYLSVLTVEGDRKITEDGLRRKMKKARNEKPEEELFYRFRGYWNRGTPDIEVLYKVKKTQKQLSEEEKSERKKQLERTKHVKEVKAKWAEAYELRREFIRNYSVAVNGTGVSNIGKLIPKYALEQRTSWGTTYNHQWDKNVIMDLLGLEPEEYEDKKAKVWEMLDGRGDIPQIRMIVAWICGGGIFWPDSPEHGWYDSYSGDFVGPKANNDNNLGKMYEFLQEIGYQLSDLEKALMDGTHPVYGKEAQA